MAKENLMDKERVSQRAAHMTRVKAIIAESMIIMEGMKAANAQYPEDQPYEYKDFERLATSLRNAVARLRQGAEPVPQESRDIKDGFHSGQPMGCCFKPINDKEFLEQKRKLFSGQ